MHEDKDGHATDSHVSDSPDWPQQQTETTRAIRRAVYFPDALTRLLPWGLLQPTPEPTPEVREYRDEL